MPNQHKPKPPEADLREPLTFYYNLGLNDHQIVDNCRDHFDTSLYGLSITSVKRFRKSWGLQSTRQQKHTFESISEYIQAIRKRFPFHGAENIRKMLRQNHGMHVPRELVGNFLRITEPDAVLERRHRRFKRKRFIGAGVNEVWAQDQHDKWKRFGLWFHNNIDPFINYNNWLKVWWSNRNSKLIASYYIEATRKIGAIPLITQSDPGTENFATANCHTTARHHLDPSLADTLQHRWMRNKTNIKCESNWSLFRRDFTPGFENLFDDGINNGWYDPGNPLESLIFRWLAIPWIQAEIDEWGIPELIRNKPERYGTLDFKIPVPPALLDELEQIYAPPHHPVFCLVPPAFEVRAKGFYAEIGEPVITDGTFWPTYRRLLQDFTNHCASDPSIQDVLSSHDEHFRSVHEEAPVEILPGLKELRNSADAVGLSAGMLPSSSLIFVEPEAAEFMDYESDRNDGQ